MRALITGIIGAAASSAAWLAFEHAQQQSFGWLVVLIGLVTGVCVHSGASGPSGGTLRGALAALLTLGGIVGGQKAYANWMQSKSTADEAVAVQTIKDVTADDDGETEDADAGEPLEDAPRVELPDSVSDAGGAGYSKSAMKKNLSEWDMIWMSLAALAAYITGKGGEKGAPAVVVSEESPPSDAGDQENSSEDA